jgi:CRP/FNR family transcriptional regulator, cyclic AMP receptor protein
MVDNEHPDSFLAHVGPEARARLERLGSHHAYAARSVLFHQGDPSRHVVILLQGWVKVTSISRDGSEALLGLRGPGDILGELAAVDNKPRSASAFVLLPVMGLSIGEGRFVEAVTHEPELGLALLRYIARNLREADRSRLSYVSTSSTARLAKMILELAEVHGERTDEGILIRLPLSQREIAMAATTSREVAARVLRKLRDRDVLSTRRRQIVLKRPEVLHSLCRTMSTDT